MTSHSALRPTSTSLSRDNVLPRIDGGSTISSFDGDARAAFLPERGTACFFRRPVVKPGADGTRTSVHTAHNTRAKNK